MANQLAVRSHTRSGDEIIVHAGCHILNYESGGAASLAGVTIRPVSSDDGSLPLDQVRGLIHQTDDPHYAPTTLICMENTHNGAGGRIVLWQIAMRQLPYTVTKLVSYECVSRVRQLNSSLMTT